MSKRDDLILLEDIIDSVKKIKEYTSNMTLSMFLNDKKTNDAVARNFEIMGEAVARMNVEFKKTHSHINWQNLKDFRNILIHSYEIIDYSIVWNIVTQKLPGVLIETTDLFATLNK
jgi:uncharacterized protein with HEPN domain